GIRDYKVTGVQTCALPICLASILFSFGKGLLFFAPGLLLVRAAWRKAPHQEARDFLAYSLLFLAGLVLVFSNCVEWSGGWTWGRSGGGWVGGGVWGGGGGG